TSSSCKYIHSAYKYPSPSPSPSLLSRSTPTMKVVILSLLAAAALVSAKSLESPDFMNHLIVCQELALASLLEPQSVSNADYEKIVKCKATSENFFLQKFGIEAASLAFAKERYEKDRPVIEAAIKEATRVFFKKLEGTQAGKDLVELNDYLAKHHLPHLEDAKKAVVV
ncbi:hypothetical protein PMAYCL1PPCAC_08094, partial [Pristionchus mayeri]